jgi:hypothetical protein
MSKSLSCLSKLKERLEIKSSLNLNKINAKNQSIKPNQTLIIYTILIGDEKIGKTSLIKSFFGDGSHIIKESPFSYYSAEVSIEKTKVF